MTRTTADRPGSSGSDSMSPVVSESVSSACAASARLAPRLHHLAHAVHGVHQVAGLDAVGCRRRQRQIARCARACAPPPQAAEARASSGDTGATTPARTRRAPPCLQGSASCPTSTEDAEPAAGLLERKQLAIADAEQRAAEHADERDAVLRIAQRTQQQRERLDFARLGEGAGAADFHRDLQRLERLHVGKQAFFCLRVRMRKSP